LGSFSCSIRPSFVLSHSMPMINTTSKLASFWRFSTGASRVNETMRRLHFWTPRRWIRVPCSRESEHGEPWRYTIRGVSPAGMSSAALHARKNASMPPRESHGRLGPIGKTGISITASSISSHSLTAVLVRLTTGHCSLVPRPTPRAENWVCFPARFRLGSP